MEDGGHGAAHALPCGRHLSRVHCGFQHGGWRAWRARSRARAALRSSPVACPLRFSTWRMEGMEPRTRCLAALSWCVSIAVFNMEDGGHGAARMRGEAVGLCSLRSSRGSTWSMEGMEGMEPRKRCFAALSCCVSYAPIAFPFHAVVTCCVSIAPIASPFRPPLAPERSSSNPTKLPNSPHPQHQQPNEQPAPSAPTAQRTARTLSTNSPTNSRTNSRTNSPPPHTGYETALRGVSQSFSDSSSGGGRCGRR